MAVVLKPKNGIRKSNSNSLNNIPRELLTEILARVASKSFTDLFNVKTSCKQFLEAASDDYIHKNITIDSFPVIPWNNITNKASTFLNKCKKSENPESLFRQGMIDYFSTESGLDYLQRATNKGHVAATYVYGVILVCYGGELRQQGLELLIKLTRSKSESKPSLIVNECREKVRKIVGEMWVHNYIVAVGHEIINCSCNCNGKTYERLSWKMSFDEEFEGDNFSCHACLWDREAIRFCNMLRTGQFKCLYA